MNEPIGGLARVVKQIEEQRAFDAVARAIEPAVRRLTRSDTAKSVLSGAPLGHRLHPMLTDVPIGCWTAASLIDAVSWKSGAPAARRLVGAGILASVPTIMTGLSDWADTQGKTRRVGVAHAGANSAALMMQLLSWRARRRGHHVRGAIFGAAGLTALSAGGYLGGHLVFAQRVGVDHEVPTISPEAWHNACRIDELVEGEPIGVTIEDARIAVVKHFGRVYALAAVCSHAGGPLDQGCVRDGTLQCPWHQSAFWLTDGTVERGPATTPQPVYATRVRGDNVEVRVVTEARTPMHAVV